MTKISKKKASATTQKNASKPIKKAALATSTKISASAPKSKRDTVPSARSHTKQAILISLLQGSKGATVDEMVEATGWQRHSVQGMISGVLKKKLGFNITSDKGQRGRVYRIGGAGK